MTISSSKRAAVGKKLKETSSKCERVHVIPQMGRWSIKAERSDKATKILNTKREAIKFARSAITGRFTRNVVVHNRDGTISSTISVGRHIDSRKTKDSLGKGRAKK